MAPRRSKFQALSGSVRRGYTVVELMMSLAVFTIGVGGVMAMQKVTVASNQHSKNLAIATHIAQAWLDELAAEAGQWGRADDLINQKTTWLTNVGLESGAATAWFRPTYNEARRFGNAFDALGNPVAPASNPSDQGDDEGTAAPDPIADRAHFCSDLRLSWLYSQSGAKEGGGLIRAQVRVFWLREGVVGVPNPPRHVCDVSIQDFDTAVGRRLYHVVYLTTAVRQHWRDGV